MMSDLSATPSELRLRLLNRPTNGLLVAFSVGIVLLLVCPGLALLWVGLARGADTAERVFSLILATMFFVVPIRIAFFAIRRRLCSGLWYPPEEERLANRTKWGLNDGRSYDWFDIILGLIVLGNAAASAWRAVHRPTHDVADTLLTLFMGIVATGYLLRTARRLGLGCH
jgi:hypothetical protein